MRLSITLIFSCAISYCFSQKITQEDQIWIRQTIQEYSIQEDIPSLVFALVDTSGIILSEKLGFANRETKSTINEESLYQIGSLSKLFTGIILNNLIQEGKIDPEKPFVFYLTDDIPASTAQKWSQVTILDLLHHRAGMPNHGPSTPPTPNGIAMRGNYTSQQLLNDLDKIPYQKNAADQPSYSNYGYGLLGYIAEKVSKKSYEELLQYYLKTPYQLQRVTSLVPTHQQVVTPYFIGKRTRPTQSWQLGAETPAGGIFANLKELAQLQQRHLKTYMMNEVDSPLFLSPSTRPLNPSGNINYGYGLMEYRSSFDSTVVKYEHGGDLDGFASQYKFFPKYGVGYVILTSSGGAWINELDALIEKRIIGAKIRKAVSLSPKQLKKYTGTYRFDSGFQFDIKKEDAVLRVLFPGNDPVSIYPASSSELFFRHMNVQIQYEFDDRGRIQQVKYIQNGKTFIPEKIK